MVTFESIIREKLGDACAERYFKALYTSPEALKSTQVTISFDTLIDIWNAGVENGLSGKAAKKRM